MPKEDRQKERLDNMSTGEHLGGTKFRQHPAQNELVWRDENGRPHIADLAEERAAQAQRARGDSKGRLPLSAIRFSPD